MNAEISLEQKGRHVSLLWALFAITSPFTHERNEITLTSDDGLYSFIVRTDINYVAFGPREDMKNPPFWTENISHGQIETLFCQFLWARYDDLRAFDWLSKLD